MKRLVVLILVAAACSGGGAGAGPTTTTAKGWDTPPLSTSTTTTTLVRTADGFQLRERAVLTVATESLLPPFYIGATPATVTGGFEYDLAKVIASKLKIGAVRVVETPKLALATGWDCGCDLVLSQATVTDQRAQEVDFSVPYLAADQAALVRAGTALTSVFDARVLRWGLVLDDDAGRTVLKEKIQPALTPTAFLDRAAALAALRAGSIDALLFETPMAMAVAQSDPTLLVPGRFVTGEQYAAMLKFGSPNTARLNDVISELESDGTIALLARRYFGVDPAAVPLLDR